MLALPAHTSEQRTGSKTQNNRQTGQAFKGAKATRKQVGRFSSTLLSKHAQRFKIGFPALVPGADDTSFRVGFGSGRIVYCKDANRPGQYPERSFDFLGYTFRPRLASNRRSDLDLAQIAAWVHPVLTDWVRYFGRFYP